VTGTGVATRSGRKRGTGHAYAQYARAIPVQAASQSSVMPMNGRGRGEVALSMTGLEMHV
jgi:hypothetical protein